jgi:hypothetical protein
MGDEADSSASNDGYRNDAHESSGRSTLYCCLSCGMPFSFSDAAYACSDQEVRDVLLFVHRIRGEVRQADPNSKANSSAQWQAERSHYLHRCELDALSRIKTGVKKTPPDFLSVCTW